MILPDWQPMPDTSHFDRKVPEQVCQASAIRAQHRRKMAIRWRSVKAREIDREMGRLPVNWHDWMCCPGVDGYQSWKCNCDTWIERAKFKKIRRRNKLGRYKHLYADKAKPQPRVLQSVKTIDLGVNAPIVLVHEVTHSFIDPPTDQVLVAGFAINASGGRRRKTACDPTWVRAKRGRLSQLQAQGR